MNFKFLYISLAYVVAIVGIAFYYTAHHTPMFIKMAEGFDGINHLMRALFTMNYVYYATLYFASFKQRAALLILSPIIIFPVADIIGMMIFATFKFSQDQEAYCSSYTYCAITIITALLLKPPRTSIHS